MKKLRGIFWKPGANGLGIGPKWLRWFLPCRKRFHEAALLHDVEYDEVGDWKTRLEDDILFFQNMLEASVNTLQVSIAMVYFYLVRMFDWAFYRYDREKQID